MPVTKSAAKRVRQNLKRHQRNLGVKRVMNREVKALVAELAKASPKNANEQLKKAQSAVDKAAAQGIIHKNKAARKKSQLAQKVKAAGTKKAPKKAAAKTAVKKPVAKKPAKKA